jgi:hypothetical protein
MGPQSISWKQHGPLSTFIFNPYPSTVVSGHTAPVGLGTDGIACRSSRNSIIIIIMGGAPRAQREKPWQKPDDSYGARYEDCSNDGRLSRLVSARPPSITCCIRDAICSNEPFCPKKSAPYRTGLDVLYVLDVLDVLYGVHAGCIVLYRAVQCSHTHRQTAACPALSCNARPSPPCGAVLRTSLDGPGWLDNSSSQSKERFRVAGVRDTEQERECECESRAPRAPGLPGF